MNRLELSIPPGLILDDTSFAVGQTGWAEVDKVRFSRNRPEVIGGWEAVSVDTFDGVCRGLFEWRDNNNASLVAVGTNEKLYVYQQGDQYEITPASGFTAGLVDGTGGQGYGTGTYSTGLYSRPSNADFFPLTWSFASYGQTLLANPRNQTIFQWSNDVTATAVSIGRTVEVQDDFTTYANQTQLNAEWTTQTGWSMDAANDQVDCDGSQASTTELRKTSYGLTVNKWYRVEVDFSNRTAGSILAFGDGVDGVASSDASGTVTVQFLAANATANVGVEGDADFIGSVDEIRIIELNAPDEVTCIVVPSQKRHVVAYGCNEESTNTFNPRAIRWCDFEDLNDWASLPTNNAGEFILEGSGRIVCAKEGPYGTFIWTNSELWFQEFVGAPGQTYRFTRLGSAGLIGPNAAVVFEGYAYWMSPDFSFWRAAPGQPPQRIQSPIQNALEDLITAVQQDKVYAASIGEHGEIWWFYPDSRDGSECSRYYSLSVLDGAWAAGQLPRTAFIDAGSLPSPLGASYDADTETGQLFYHERGSSANGGPISWSMKTGDFYIAEASRVVQLKGLWPDIEEQAGQASLTVSVRQFPQSDETQYGPYAMRANQNRVHFITSGRVVNLTFSGNTSPARFRLGRVNLEYNVRGTR